ncbi:MAG: hypothetical protein KIT16_22155 [Rhodospirillaceae bacterium]|nr:hypothetical protein [Rhodospirillaceae bacterium]
MALLCLVSMVLAALAAGPASAHGPHGHAHHRDTAPAAQHMAPAAAPAALESAYRTLPRDVAATFVIAATDGADHHRGCQQHGPRCCSAQCCTTVAFTLPTTPSPALALTMAADPAVAEQPPDAPLATHLKPPSL